MITNGFPTGGSNALAKNNTEIYVPTGDYNPATKKYVDDLVTNGVFFMKSLLPSSMEENVNYKSTMYTAKLTSDSPTNLSGTYWGSAPFNSFITGTEYFGGGASYGHDANLYCSFDLPYKLSLTSWYMKFYYSNGDYSYVSSVVVWGKKDDGSYEKITQIYPTCSGTDPQSFALPHVGFYKGYKLSWTMGGNSGRTTVGFFGGASLGRYYPAPVLNYTVSGFSSYFLGATLKIQFPPFPAERGTQANLINPYININGLGLKQINGTVTQNTPFTIVYNGTSFDVQS